METPSDRVLSSWRAHAREGWEVEKYKHYRPRIIMPFDPYRAWYSDIAYDLYAYTPDVRTLYVGGRV